MEVEKRLKILQNTYAASVAETVNTYEKLNVLKAVVARRKERQKETAPYLNQSWVLTTLKTSFIRSPKFMAVQTGW
ncbi:MAG: hypothetical protein WBI55_06020 [Eubacteriales bacterium]|jgi:hypothetical protein